MIQGIVERVMKELTALAPQTLFSRWCFHQCLFQTASPGRVKNTGHCCVAENVS